VRWAARLISWRSGPRGTVALTGDPHAGHQSAQIPLPGPRVRLVEVVEVEDELVRRRGTHARTSSSKPVDKLMQDGGHGVVSPHRSPCTVRDPAGVADGQGKQVAVRGASPW